MRLGRRAAQRRAAGGPAVKGREALSIAGYRQLSRMIYVRAGSRCERCRRFVSPQLEHAIPRSAGGPDAWWNCWNTCTACHRLKEAPFATGRLLVIPQGDGHFKFQLVQGTKYAYRTVEISWGGRQPTLDEQAALAALV